MKKPKRSGRNLNARRGAKRNNRHAKHNKLAETIRRMAAEGKVEDEIAQMVGMDKNLLRAKFIDAIKLGKSATAASEAEDEALTVDEYHALDAITDAFSSHWHDEIDGNVIFRGTDGKCARSVADAFAAWKQRSGRWNCCGLSTRFDEQKKIEFAKIAMDYRTKFETGKTDE